MTTTRWKCETRSFYKDDVHAVEIMDEQDIYCAEAYGDTEQQALDIANRIVREHNAHAAMVEALEEAIEGWAHVNADDTTWSLKAKAALRLAKGG